MSDVLYGDGDENFGTMVKLGETVAMRWPAKDLRGSYIVGEHRMVKAWKDGEDETAETLRVVVTVKVGDITISRGKRVSIVEPTAQTEEEKEEAAKPAEKPADETADDADASKEEASDASKEEAAQPANPSEMTEEEMAQQAMEEGNFDPAASSF